jgi:hypothetical protein
VAESFGFCLSRRHWVPHLSLRIWAKGASLPSPQLPIDREHKEAKMQAKLCMPAVKEICPVPFSLLFWYKYAALEVWMRRMPLADHVDG